MNENKTIILEQNKQEILTIIEALQLYKDIAVKPMYNEIIERQVLKIVDQLQIQGISIYKKDYEPEFRIGEIINYDNKNAIVVGSANEDFFIKIAVWNKEGMINIIDVPCVLCERIPI